MIAKRQTFICKKHIPGAALQAIRGMLTKHLQHQRHNHRHRNAARHANGHLSLGKPVNSDHCITNWHF